MGEDAAALVLATIRMHFQVGNTALTAGQLDDHDEYGVCPACSDGIDIEAAIAARDLVAS